MRTGVERNRCVLMKPDLMLFFSEIESCLYIRKPTVRVGRLIVPSVLVSTFLNNGENKEYISRTLGRKM